MFDGPTVVHVLTRRRARLPPHVVCSTPTRRGGPLRKTPSVRPSSVWPSARHVYNADPRRRGPPGFLDYLSRRDSRGGGRHSPALVAREELLVTIVDWTVVLAYIVWIVYDGLRRSKGTDKVEGYFLANRSLPWWAVGLSVMATQMSAVTLVGTTGQAYATGFRFIQFYFGLPLAMIILSVTVVPFFHRARVYTAYEYLERRFDVRTRTLASFLFLMGRAFSLGVTLAPPAVVISAILGWRLPVTVFVICIPMILYTSIGGVQAVAWTDVKQMFIIVGGMSAAVIVLALGIPKDVGLMQAMSLAGATGRLQAIDFRFDLRETYTFWSGL